jgi:hypothetical protein
VDRGRKSRGGLEAVGAASLVVLAVAGRAATAAPGADLARERPVVRAVWVDVSGTVDGHAAVREAIRLFATMGVRLEMRVAPPGTSIDPATEIQVVGVPSDKARRADSPLGSTTSGGARVAWVNCGRVRELLRPHGGRVREGAALATAVGRVAAHELVHALVPERGHAGSGLMAPRFGPDALESAALAVDGATRTAVLRLFSRSSSAAFPPASGASGPPGGESLLSSTNEETQ